MSALPQSFGGFNPPMGNPLAGFAPPPPDDGDELDPDQEEGADEETIYFHPDCHCDTEEERDETAKRLYQRFREFADSPQRREAERAWDAADRLYFGFKRTNSPHEVVIREIWRQEQTMLTQLNKGLSAGDVLFKFEPRLEGFDAEAEGATAVIHDQLKRGGSRDQLDMFNKCFGHYGNAYIVPGFRSYKRNQYKCTPVYAPDEEDSFDKESTEVNENLPFLENIVCRDVYVHPKIDEAKNSTCFIRKEITQDGLKTRIREEWIDPDETRRAVEAGERSGEIPDGIGNSPFSDDFQFKDEENRTHTIYICWENGFEFVMLNGSHILRAMPLEGGEAPIISRRFDPMPDQHYSFGLPIILADEQGVVNQIIAYKLGNMGLCSSPPLMTKRGTDAKKDWNNLTIAPGGRTVFEVDDMTHAAFMQTPQLQGMMSEEVEFWQQHQKEQTGITDRLSGNGQNSGTATGAEQLSQAASERLQDTIRRLTPAFEEMYRWMYNLNARHQQQTYNMRIIGADGAKVFARYTPEIFTPDVDVAVEIGGGVSAQNAMTWANNIKILGGIPGYDMMAFGDQLLKASGVMRPKQFHTSSTNSQGDALGENEQLQMAGIIADPKPGDNHAQHLQIHQMFMATPLFQSLPPDAQRRMASHVAIHMQFAQAMQSQQGMAAQQSMQAMGGGQGPMGGPTAVQNQANASANGKFMMGDMGAAAMGAQRGAA